MPDAFKTDTQLLDRFPDPIARERGQHVSGRGLIEYQALRDMLVTLRSKELQAHTRMLDAGQVVSNPTTANTIALYRVNLTAGNPMVAGLAKHFAAGTDQLFIGGSDITALKLDGTAGVALSADGKTYNAVLVAFKVGSDIERRIILGDEADDGMEAAVSAANILASLKAASIANLDATVFLVMARFKIQRVAVNTITLTHTSTTTDSGLAGERGLGHSGDPVT